MSTIQHPPGAGGEQVPRGRGADPAAAGDTLGGFETRLLAELQMLVTERVATAGQEAGPAGRRAGKSKARHPAGRAWPAPRLAMTGGLAASLAAILAATLTLTSAGGARPPAGNFAPPVTAAAVLNNAALASLREATVTPRPGQFVYTKTYATFHNARHHGIPAMRVTQSIESWKSVGGTRRGLTVFSGPSTKTIRDVVMWCAHGFVRPPETVGKHVVREPCTARQFADYKPWLPTTPAGMRAYLEGTLARGCTDLALCRHGKNAPQNMLEEGFYLVTQIDLTPAQQAALYHALASIRGLTVVPKVTDVLGRVGVGIRSHAVPGTWMAIFDPTTFKPLGWIDKTRLVDDRTAVAVPATIVDKAGQRP